MSKKWENFETLQLAPECHSINKNQSLIKIKSVVPMKNAKNSEICETLQLAAECHSINKNQSLIKIKSVVHRQKWQKLRNSWNFATVCRMPQHEQKSKFDEDQ